MENSSRPTLDFATGSGAKLVLYTYITGREFNEIQGTYMDNAKITLVNGQPQVEGFDPKSDERATAKLIEKAVVSVNGVTENVLELVMNLPSTDYLEIVEKLNEISGKKKLESKSNQ